MYRCKEVRCLIIEMYHLKDEKKEGDSITVALSPETKEEEKSLRNAKILHKNRLMVWWGDTLEISCRDKFLGFSGLKICFRLPSEHPIVEPVECPIAG